MIPFHLFSEKSMKEVGKRFRWFGRKLSGVFPFVKYDLLEADVRVPHEDYLAASLISAFVISLFMFAISYAVLAAREAAPDALPAVAGSFFLLVFFLLFYVFYPSIRAKTVALKINLELLYALRDLLVQIQSGISLYDSMVNIATANYGNVSKEFADTVREINAGVIEEVALERMALRTKSEYLKKAILQILNAVSGGASLKDAVRTTLSALENHQINLAREYATKLNFLTLLYMLIAAAIPSIGVTFLIILSTFSGIGINEQTIFVILLFSAMLQLVLIGYVKSVRPVIY
jgi:flagellar protein FlaJ